MKRKEVPVNHLRDGHSVSNFGFRNALDSFKTSFIDENRGKPLFLLRVRNLRGTQADKFIEKIPEYIDKANSGKPIRLHYYILGDENTLILGVAPTPDSKPGILPNIDGAVGKLHEEALRNAWCTFDFGIGRTQCNYISTVDEIYEDLEKASEKNLRDNLVRWSWTYLNRANDYFANIESNAVIQPVIRYNHKTETYSLKGGEVFVGGALYQSYAELIRDIPQEQDLNRIELLILEKLVMACHDAPGLLKFNISPQTLIDTFNSPEKVYRFNELLLKEKLSPHNVRLELVEKPYEEEEEQSLKNVCRYFFQFGITFAADDFGVKSQSHQVVLDLGEMIKEFKLDPISFRFKPEEDHTKFLDNLAFIDYCARLAGNRDAIITAEAVDDYDTLHFLIAHQVHYFQANIFARKMAIQEYRDQYARMQDLPDEVVKMILESDELSQELDRTGNIFIVAKEHGLH